MNILTRWLSILVGVGLVVVAVSLPVWAQSASPVYYATQLGRGSLTALAGGLTGMLVSSLSAELIGVAVAETEIGFVLGASLGATWGVVQVAAAYGVRGDPLGAFVGAFAGSLMGLILLPDSADPHLHWQMGAKGFRIESSVIFTSLINPVTLAALGATIGYNVGTPSKERAPATITMALFALQF